MEAFCPLIKIRIRRSILPKKPVIIGIWPESSDRLMQKLSLISCLTIQPMPCENSWKKSIPKATMLKDFNWNLNRQIFIKTRIPLKNIILLFLISGLSTLISSKLRFSLIILRLSKLYTRSSKRINFSWNCSLNLNPLSPALWTTSLFQHWTAV